MRLGRKGIVAVLLATALLCCLYITTRGAPGSTVPAALVSLVHQKEMTNVIEMIRNVEDRFNRDRNYDWVLLSEENFNEPFMEAVSAFVSGNVYFRTINRKRDWRVPPDINKNELINEMHNLDNNGVPDGGSNTFRIKANFLSKAIVEYLPEYTYFALISDDIRLYCDMDDVFKEMKQRSLKLAFTVSSSGTPHGTKGMPELVSNFIKDYKPIVKENHWVDTFVEPGTTYCEFGMGFIAWDLRFLRSKQYSEWYDAVDESGGIFYNRWSASAVQTMAAALFLDLSEVQFLSRVGVYDAGRINCPTSKAVRLAHRCTCPFDPRLDPTDRNKIFTYREGSCTPRFLKLQGSPLQAGWDQYSDDSTYKQFMETQ